MSERVRPLPDRATWCAGGDTTDPAVIEARCWSRPRRDPGQRAWVFSAPERDEGGAALRRRVMEAGPRDHDEWVAGLGTLTPFPLPRAGEGG